MKSKTRQYQGGNAQQANLRQVYQQQQPQLQLEAEQPRSFEPDPEYLHASTLRSIQRHDPTITDIPYKLGFATVYGWVPERGWLKSFDKDSESIEGPMFVITRYVNNQLIPYLLVLNRKSVYNFQQRLDNDSIEFVLPFIVINPHLLSRTKLALWYSEPACAQDAAISLAKACGTSLLAHPEIMARLDELRLPVPWNSQQAEIESEIERVRPFILQCKLPPQQSDNEENDINEASGTDLTPTEDEVPHGGRSIPLDVLFAGALGGGGNQSQPQASTSHHHHHNNGQALSYPNYDSPKPQSISLDDLFEHALQQPQALPPPTQPPLRAPKAVEPPSAGIQLLERLFAQATGTTNVTSSQSEKSGARPVNPTPATAFGFSGDNQPPWPLSPDMNHANSNGHSNARVDGGKQLMALLGLGGQVEDRERREFDRSSGSEHLSPLIEERMRREQQQQQHHHQHLSLDQGNSEERVIWQSQDPDVREGRDRQLSGVNDIADDYVRLAVEDTIENHGVGQDMDGEVLDRQTFTKKLRGLLQNPTFLDNVYSNYVERASTPGSVRSERSQALPNNPQYGSINLKNGRGGLPRRGGGGGGGGGGGEHRVNARKAVVM